MTWLELYKIDFSDFGVVKMILSRLHQLSVRALNRIKWFLTAISGALTTGFVIALET